MRRRPVEPPDQDPAASVVVRAKQVEPISEPGAADGAARRLRLFYEVARAVNQIEDINALLGRMLDVIVDVLRCERGVIELTEPGAHGGGIASAVCETRRIVRVRTQEGEDTVVISRSVKEATLARRQAVIASEDGTLSSSMIQNKIRSAMAAPLALGARVFGLIYVDDRGKGDRFAEHDLDFLSALAHITAAALDSAERFHRAATAIEVLSSESPLDELIGESGAMRRLKAQIRKYAASPSAHVLIHGESGTGKELVARTLHALSPRAGRPLVTLNCAAMPETMVESELFGHVRGAFTGAVRDQRGKFILADKGTLFLDEIGDLSLSAQAKVLRAVQEGEVQPLGSEKTSRVDVRILSATHRDLLAAVVDGRFREDLFYRLNVLELSVPPLRERPEDIPLLARIFLKAAAARMGKRVGGFTERALAALSRYRFPGNVRELRNEAERAVIDVEGGAGRDEAVLVDIFDLNDRISGARPSPLSLPPGSLQEQYAAIEPTERALVLKALAQAKGNISEAGRLLGISRVMLKARLKRFGIDGDDPE